MSGADASTEPAAGCDANVVVAAPQPAQQIAIGIGMGVLEVRRGGGGGGAVTFNLGGKERRRRRHDALRSPENKGWDRGRLTCTSTHTEEGGLLQSGGADAEVQPRRNVQTRVPRRHVRRCPTEPLASCRFNAKVMTLRRQSLAILGRLC